MDETAISRAFSASMRLARDSHHEGGGVGFQAKICADGLFSPSNFSQIINKDKGTKEPRRRIAVERVASLLPDFPAKTYEDFLDLGRWILDGNDPEQWRPGKPVTPPPHPPTLPTIPPTLPGFHITNKAALELAEWIEEASDLIDYGEVVKGIVAREFPAFMEFLKKRAEGGGLQTVQGHQDRKVANGNGDS